MSLGYNVDLELMGERFENFRRTYELMNPLGSYHVRQTAFQNPFLASYNFYRSFLQNTQFLGKKHNEMEKIMEKGEGWKHGCL